MTKEVSFYCEMCGALENNECLCNWDEKVIPAPKPLSVDEDGNPIDFSYKGMMEEVQKRKRETVEIEEFREKIKSVSFSRVPGGGRE